MSKLTIYDWTYRELETNLTPMISRLRDLDLPEDLKEDLRYMGYGLPDYEAAATDEGWILTDLGKFANHQTEEEDTSYAESWKELCETQCIDTVSYEPEVFEYWLVSRGLADALIKHDEKVIKEFLGLGPIWCRTATGQSVEMDTVIEDIYNEVMGDR